MAKLTLLWQVPRIRWAIGSISRIEQRPPCELKCALTLRHMAIKVQVSTMAELR